MDGQRLEFYCADIEDGGDFPPVHTGRGADRSPEFVLSNLSQAAGTLAVTLEDLDHPIRNFTHWVIWNIPAAERIPAAIPAGRRVSDLGGAVQGRAYGFHRYAGPKPPGGSRHRYRFTVYALDGPLALGPGAGKRDFLRAAEGRIVQCGSLTASFPGK